MVESIKFTTFQLVIGDSNPTIEMLEDLLIKAPKVYEKQGASYKVTQRLDKSKNYYWLYAEYGKPLPLPEHLFDVDKHTTTKNQRTSNLAELGDQLFALYSFDRSLLILSNSKKSGFIEEYMKTYLDKGITIKKIFKSAEEFLEIVTKIDSVRLISYNSDLFSQRTGLFDEASNIFGLGNPDQLSLELRFGRVDKTLAFRRMFLHWRQRKEKCEIDNLVCVGRDDKDMEFVFNTDSFTNIIEIKAQKHKHGMYSEHEIENAIYAEISK